MLKKGFYDLITVLGFVLAVAVSILMSNVATSEILGNNLGALSTMLFTQLIVGAIIFIYWAFILLLAISLYTKGSLLLIEIVLAGILIPFSPIIYLLLLRKPLKDYHEDNKARKKKSIGNVPGTP